MLVCTDCNHFRLSEDKAIGVVLLQPCACATCGARLTQANVHKADARDRAAIESARRPFAPN